MTLLEFMVCLAVYAVGFIITWGVIIGLVDSGILDEAPMLVVYIWPIALVLLIVYGFGCLIFQIPRHLTIWMCNLIKETLKHD